MRVEEIFSVLERQPFWPFAVRLNNGMQYRCNEPRNVGAPEDYHFTIYFGKSDVVRIDTDSFAEISEQR